jgi:hypothetical protein
MFVFGRLNDQRGSDIGVDGTVSAGTASLTKSGAMTNKYLFYAMRFMVHAEAG